ncbi:MAG: AsmA-like C-terminal region-containing protein [Catalinimonas sp.]
MKKVLIALGVLIGLILLVAVLVPVLFKDKIKAQVDQALAESLTADVYYDADNFSLSLLRHFPNVTVGLEHFGVVGRDPFAGDTLAAVDRFEVVVNLLSVFGDQIKVNSVMLERPRLLAEVLSDGRASWDIVAADSTVVADTTGGEATFAVQIDEWRIDDGEVIYLDNQSKMYLHLLGLDHRGSGDLTQDVFDVETSTQIDFMSFEFDTVKYLDGQRLRADVSMNINLPESKYTFRDNTVRLNEFAFGFDGFVALPDTNTVRMDVTYQARETEFRNVLSLVPGVYTESFDDLQTSGTLAFDGYAKGTYDLLTGALPAFGLNLNVRDGRVKYPDLPTPLEGIQVDLAVEKPQGDLEGLAVNLKQFVMQLGENPVEARAKTKGLAVMEVDAMAKARVDLAQMTEVFPLEGITLRGRFDLDADVKGTYSDSLKQMPTVEAAMGLSDGYVKSADVPAPLENMAMQATVTNQTGALSDTKVRVPQFDFTLDDKPFRAKAYLENPDDLYYEVDAEGTVNLRTIDEMFDLAELAEMPGLEIAGIITADLETSGRMSDVEAERYGQLPARGTVEVRDFRYRSPDLPQGVTIDRTALTFNPDRIQVDEYIGTVGSSTINLTGSVQNHIGYLFGENQTLRGRMDLRSPRFDVNEWLTGDTTATTADTAALEPVEIPRDIDFVLTTAIAEVIYDDMQLDDVRGRVVVRDGVVSMEGLTFQTLGGTIGMAGSYDPRDLARPTFDFDLDISEVSIPRSYATFNAVQALAPVAEKMQGNFSTKFKLGGVLDRQMSPVLSSLNGGGLIRIADAAVQNLNLLGKMNSLTKLNAPTAFNLKNVAIQAAVRDGGVVFDPFDVNLGDTKLTLGGSQGFTGQIDYVADLDVPAGQVGQAVTSTLSSLIGQSVSAPERLTMAFGVGGTYTDPKVRLLSAGPAGGGGVKATVQNKVDDLKQEVEQRAREEADRLKKEAEQRAREEAARAKAEAEQRAREEADRLKQEAERRAKEEADRLKKRFGIPR